MKLKKFLEERRPLILERWFQTLLEEYPSHGRQFIANIKKDRFENPMGFTLFEGLEGLFDYLLHKRDLNGNLDTFIRLRAVQELKPSQALSFIFILKNIIQKEISILSDQTLMEDFLSLSEEIDALGLRLFDIYMESRERLNEVRFNEMKNMTAWILKKVNILKEYSE
ncbi:MAG: RsbRD N-terminal domain-containing protein [Thermodesulfovibrionales bacterium]|nr:RsbRD N-terminal domain-containing protein [Thermodesulfovibrionales bacterium]